MTFRTCSIFSSFYLDASSDAVRVEVNLQHIAQSRGGRGEGGVQAQLGLAKGLGHLQRDRLAIILLRAWQLEVIGQAHQGVVDLHLDIARHGAVLGAVLQHEPGRLDVDIGLAGVEWL